MTDKAGRTELMYAVIDKEYKKVKELINSGIDVNAKDNFGNIPLGRAIKPYIDKRIIEILLKSNSDINIENNSGISVKKLVDTVVNFEYKDLFQLL